MLAILFALITVTLSARTFCSIHLFETVGNTNVCCEPTYTSLSYLNDDNSFGFKCLSNDNNYEEVCAMMNCMSPEDLPTHSICCTPPQRPQCICTIGVKVCECI